MITDKEKIDLLKKELSKRSFPKILGIVSALLLTVSVILLGASFFTPIVLTSFDLSIITLELIFMLILAFVGEKELKKRIK